jgi:hypothetical protein
MRRALVPHPELLTVRVFPGAGHGIQAPGYPEEALEWIEGIVRPQKSLAESSDLPREPR